MMSRAASGFALVVSGSVLLGWQFDLPILRSILPGRAAMSPLTAVTFVLIATALWLETESSGGHRPIRWLARAAASLALLVGLVTVFGYDLGENLSLDQSRFLDRLGTDGIEPHTGLCFVLLSAALLLLDSESRPRVWPAQFILLISAVISLTSLLRYAYRAEAGYGLAPSFPLALPTPATLFVLSLGTLLAPPGRAILARASTLSEALPQILEAIGKSLDWSLAIHWSFDAEQHVLQCTETWMAPSRTEQALADQSRRMTFPSGVGLPGRIWSSGRSAWIVDVVRDTNFPRAPSATVDGLHGAFGFPVVGPSGFLGVMEFFSTEIREPDDALLEMFDAVGRQIGEFIERTIAQAAGDRARRAAEGGRLLQAQENEARRIARELHDDLGQGLALLTVKMDLLRQKPPEAADQLGARMQELLAHVRHLSSSVHDLSHQLHPSKLEQLGLVAAIGGLCRELTHHHGLKIEFTHDQMPAAISPDTALCLYRIAQEGLQNAIKHSGAQQAEVTLNGAADAISLRIVDHGRGFDPRQLHGRSGLGLVSMRERVRYLGGEIAIDSPPSGGTRLYVRVPLREIVRETAPPRTG